jgi:hypothetical protein
MNIVIRRNDTLQIKSIFRSTGRTEHYVVSSDLLYLNADGELHPVCTWFLSIREANAAIRKSDEPQRLCGGSPQSEQQVVA